MNESFIDQKTALFEEYKRLDMEANASFALLNKL